MDLNVIFRPLHVIEQPLVPQVVQPCALATRISLAPPRITNDQNNVDQTEMQNFRMPN